MGKLKTLEEEELKRSQIGLALEQQASDLSFLKERLKPFNLYFEWSEVQKLRALVQLLDTEHAAGHEANKLINAFYFAYDRFAVAYGEQADSLENTKKMVFYFINKNGNPVKKLGVWDKVEQFDEYTDLAKVERNDKKAA